MKIKAHSQISKPTGTRILKYTDGGKNEALKVWNSGIAKPIPQLTQETQRAAKIILTYQAAFESPSKKLYAIKKGLLSTAIKDLGELIGSNQAFMANLLSITEPTLRKYIKERKQLNSNKSEHIIELFELFEKGVDTFGSLEEFKNWIYSPNVNFQESPVKLLDTITGINMVKNALLRLDYGVLA